VASTASVAFYENVAESEEWGFARREGRLGDVAEDALGSCASYQKRTIARFW
jgi:hypothetical protein